MLLFFFSLLNESEKASFSKSVIFSLNYIYILLAKLNIELFLFFFSKTAIVNFNRKNKQITKPKAFYLEG